MGAIGKAIGITTSAAIGGAIGTATGAAWGGNTPGSNIEASAKIGLATGATAGLIAGAATAFPKQTAKGALAVGAGVGHVAIGAVEAVGAGAIAGVEATGTAAIGAAKVALPVAAYAAGKYSSIAAGVGSKLIKPTNNENNMLGHKMTGLGAGLVFGSAVLSGATEAFNDFNRNRMGQSDGQITRATPRTPSYANNAGATGDLVFAMNRNRKG